MQRHVRDKDVNDGPSHTVRHDLNAQQRDLQAQ